jgi:hypothetical protein
MCIYFDYLRDLIKSDKKNVDLTKHCADESLADEWSQMKVHISFYHKKKLHK